MWECNLSHILPPVPLSKFAGKSGSQSKIIAPASTFQFVPKNGPLPEAASTEDHGIPPGTHWVDWAAPETIVLIDQPSGQSCAAVGGIMALRMKVLGVKAAVVNGRVRDLDELQASKLPVCSWIPPGIRPLLRLGILNLWQTFLNAAGFSDLGSRNIRCGHRSGIKTWCSKYTYLRKWSFCLTGMIWTRQLVDLLGASLD